MKTHRCFTLASVVFALLFGPKVEARAQEPPRSAPEVDPTSRSGTQNTVLPLAVALLRGGRPMLELPALAMAEKPLTLSGLTPTLPTIRASIGRPEGEDIRLGDKLRIRLAQGKVVGTLAALDENTLTLKDLTTAEITAHSLNTVRAVEVSRGRHSRGRNTKKGALIGGAVGAALGVAGTLACDQSEEGCGGGWVLIGGAAVGATGALLGALIGAVVSPGEAWRPVNLKGLHASVTPVRGGAHFRVTVAF